MAGQNKWLHAFAIFFSSLFGPRNESFQSVIFFLSNKMPGYFPPVTVTVTITEHHHHHTTTTALAASASAAASICNADEASWLSANATLAYTILTGIVVVGIWEQWASAQTPADQPVSHCFLALIHGAILQDLIPSLLSSLSILS